MVTVAHLLQVLQVREITTPAAKLGDNSATIIVEERLECEVPQSRPLPI